MNIVTRLKTEAEQAIAHAYQALPEAAAGRSLRAAAFARFEATGLPHRRVEAYKYTDLKALVRRFLPPAGMTAPLALAALRQQQSEASDTVRLVIVDGRYRPDLSDAVPAGVRVSALADVLAEGRADLIAALSGPAIADGDPVLALNAALMSDGVVIEVTAGVTVAPAITLTHVVTADDPVSVHTRSLVVLNAGAALGLIERHVGAHPGHQRTDVLHLVVGDGGAFEHVVAKTDATALDLSTLTATVGADARVTSFALVTAGEITRRQHFVRMAGDRSVLTLKGASLLNAEMHADTTLVVEHDSLACQSRELFRHVIDDAAHGVFQGKVIVRPGAQKTDGKMASNALLLSDGAEMDNKPELEIFADDVACGHGATCGEIDERPIFYLMSRGLPRTEAEALLIQSFVGEVVDSVGEGPLASQAEALRDAFTASIERWLAARRTSA